jgi:CHASE2 domain-containing sensor protein
VIWTLQWDTRSVPERLSSPRQREHRGTERPRSPINTALLLLLIPATLYIVYADWLWRWDKLFYDLNINFWSRSPPNDIVLVTIDEESLTALGPWPWPRRLHAALIKELMRAGAKAMAFAISFAEPDTRDPGGDELFAKALRDSGRVVLPVLPARLGGQIVEILPMPALAAATASLGHVDIELDQDGIARSVYLKAGTGNLHWPSLALAMLRLVDPQAWQTLPGERSPLRTQSSPYAWIRDYRIGISFAGPPDGSPASLTWIPCTVISPRRLFGKNLS